MSNTLTAQLSDEAQEALEFLQEQHIDVNRTIDRIVMRAAQEAGWHISLVPVGEVAAVPAVEPVVADGELKRPEPQATDENTHLLPQAPQEQAKADDQKDVPTPVPVGKPFEPGVVMAEKMRDEGDLPHKSSVIKKTVDQQS